MPVRMPVEPIFFLARASQAKPSFTGWGGVLGGSSNLVFGKGSHNPTGKGTCDHHGFFSPLPSVMGPDPPSRGKNYTFLESKPPTTYIHWDPPSSRSQQKSFCPTKKSTSKIEDWTLIFSIPTSETP